MAAGARSRFRSDISVLLTLAMVAATEFPESRRNGGAAELLKRGFGFIAGFVLGAILCGATMTAIVVGSMYVLPLSGADYVMLRNVMFAASIGAGIGVGSWTSNVFRKTNFGIGSRLHRLVRKSPAHVSATGSAADLMEICTNQIAGSWLHYNKVLKFKAGVAWSEILYGFALLMHDFVEKNYPTLYAGGPDLFLHVLYRGVRLTQWPSPAEIETAIANADGKLNKTFRAVSG